MHKSEDGGSLYVKINNGDCVQDRICSFGSKTVNELGVYCYILYEEDSTLKNYLLDSTMTSSGEDITQGEGTVCLICGETHMRSINISYSKLNDYCIYHVYSSFSSNVTLSTFSNNTGGPIGRLILSGSPEPELYILFCNIFENEGTTLIQNFYV
ncbi:hypothetical protein TVAGG3_0798390, partial [Trichomonas vaginalis G3]